MQKRSMIVVPMCVIAMIAALASCSSGPSSTTAPDRPRTFAERKAQFAEHTAEVLAEYDTSNARVDLAEMFSPGVPRDGISALTDPERWNVADSSYPADHGRVVAVVIDGDAVAYPLGILGVHEIVNDTVGETPIAVTYCPLCDSASVFDRRLAVTNADGSRDTLTLEFGVSGMLCRSNLTMYDRTTMSLWSQADMRAITGPYAGRSMPHLPVHIMRFGDFKAAHPDGRVLSTLTGHDEDYEADQYSEYFASDRLYMPVDHGDAFPPKTLGLGVLHDNDAWFVTREAAMSGPVEIATPAGSIVVSADDAGMHAEHSAKDVQTMQCFYFAWSAFHPASRIIGPRPAETLLDGHTRSFIIVGYSTSYAWPDMLQDMLDAHARADGDSSDRIYHVLNAVIGGSPVERWIGEPGSRNYEPTFGAMLRDFFGESPRLRGDLPTPTIALCQQSLQFTRTQRGPIADTDDAEGVRIGADALERHAQMLHEAGLDRVYIAMHIYKEPIEPEVGNERIALAAVLDRGHAFIHQGPDVWTATRDAFPRCFDEDGVHPNELGMKMMAEGWYRTIAGPDARQDVIDQLYARKYPVNDMMREYIRWRRGG